MGTFGRGTRERSVVGDVPPPPGEADAFRYNGVEERTGERSVVGDVTHRPGKADVFRYDDA